VAGGSGTDVTIGVKVRSSRVKETPARSPLMVIWVIPPAKVASRNSFGLDPALPESARLELKAEVRVATGVKEALKAVKVSGTAYVK
jgi:hypothetical protein